MLKLSGQINCWLKGDRSSKRVSCNNLMAGKRVICRSSKRVSYNHLMAGNDVQARPMIIKATESQPLPSEAFIVTRGREGGSNIQITVFSIVWLVGLTWSIHTILWLHLDEQDVAETFFNRSYQPHVTKPFGVWTENRYTRHQ